MFGLTDADIKRIIAETAKHTEIEQLIIFGSRAIGNYKKGSDVDLALVGKAVNNKTAKKLSIALNENSPMPYYFDVIDYHQIQNKDLKQHIDEKGIVIYTKK